MGAGATIEKLPEMVTLEAGQALCGDKNIALIFDLLKEGETETIPRKKFLEYLNVNSKVSEVVESFLEIAGSDATGCSTISRSDMLNVCKKRAYDISAEEESNTEGLITFKEYLPVMLHKARLKDLSKEVKESFQVFDVNGDGFITVEEMREAMHLLGDDVSMEEAEAMIRDADVNSDGKIDIHEYGRKINRDNLPDILNMDDFILFFGSTATSEMFDALKDHATGTVSKEKVLNYEKILAKVHNFRKEFDIAGEFCSTGHFVRLILFLLGIYLHCFLVSLVSALFIDFLLPSRVVLLLLLQIIIIIIIMTVRTLRIYIETVKANGDAITPDQAMLLINSWGYDVKKGDLGVDNVPLTFKTFLNVMFTKATLNEQQVEAVATFKTFDEDGDGFVTAEELRRGLSMMGDQITHEEAHEMVKDADVDGDGRLNYMEYKEKLGFASGSDKA